MLTRNMNRSVCISLLLAVTLGAAGCNSTGGKTAAGAGIGAIIGGAAGYIIAGEKGALVGAGAGALVGGGAGYALAKKEERQRASEQQIKAEAEQAQAPITEPILDIQQLTATPKEVAPGNELQIAIDLRAVSGTDTQIVPPTVNVSLLRDGKVLREQEITADNTGDITLIAAFNIPKNAQPGTYTIQAKPIAQAGVTAPLAEATFDVAQAAPAATEG